MKPEGLEEKITQCLLDDGRILEYDEAISLLFFNKQGYTHKYFETKGLCLLGEGVFYSYDGMIDHSKNKTKSYFYKRI